MDGSNCCILWGYGAYGGSITPWFTICRSIAKRGVVLAYAHVRGGGEKGEAWHKAGYKTTKPNTWKDFISCAEYLIKQGYTSPGKLAGSGTSAGGILISRALCYCFGFNRAMLFQELRTAGHSQIPNVISAELKSGNCACEVCNPQGSCCLGTIAAAIKMWQKI